ncbi:MetQ/NlpA family ABC transporter substrate-binding protein [Fredinandcohnia sp. QZ13]|uniref:MetQ/NlpA family ABC transporter substrate-binding protein n=1 Tax=Fredinandcohnia sp. QZ13 TaxID=3073144 RepID=UPI0028534554|nr:MetQ/NlpA family ABC transporter substrate-binding protein [Fredinandcohnia sp. QZ13]MDR4888311.1 MetQ/NlpA family ABC transporter substrate-binding protein [Fredinandcohnia sp. QZ13]
MKKIFLPILLLTLVIFTAACSNNSASGKDSETKKVKIGITGTDTRTWDYVAEKAAKEGIEIELVSFSDYVLPNTALADNEIDANSFQTVAYFDQFIEEHNLDLVPIATTYLAPMAIYSDELKDVKEIKDGAKIALPNDVSNQGRALLLLQEAGLLKLVDNYDGLGSIKEAIVENPKNLELIPTAPAQIPRALPDVDAGIINNGFARDAGLNPIDDSIFHESETAIDYLNIISVNKEDKDDETLNRIAELFQEDDTADFINKEHGGTLIPTFVPLENIGW